MPTPHRGGDSLHDWYADTFPPNRFPGQDALVAGKHFDALQVVGVDVLWEIKTDRFDTYSPFLQNQVIPRQLTELKHEREIAVSCGYGFAVGVCSPAHKAALRQRDPTLIISVMGC